jgi:hypothetical protein
VVDTRTAGAQQASDLGDRSSTRGLQDGPGASKDASIRGRSQLLFEPTTL